VQEILSDLVALLAFFDCARSFSRTRDAVTVVISEKLTGNVNRCEVVCFLLIIYTSGVLLLGKSTKCLINVCCICSSWKITETSRLFLFVGFQGKRITPACLFMNIAREDCG